MARAGTITLTQSARRRDADAWLAAELARLPPGLVAVDAPLSLPGVYRALPGYTDHHYRRVDRELRAMSPMFLGGLTARAVALAGRFRESGWTVVETYPAALVRTLGWEEAYAGKRASRAEVAESAALHELHAWCAAALLPCGELPELLTFHRADAVLCLLAAVRFVGGTGLVLGDRDEGQIVL